MSFIDHFDRRPDHGFTLEIDPETARRQFRLSLGLVAVIVLATLSAMGTLGLTPRGMDSGLTAQANVRAPQILHIRQAAQGPVGRTGG